MQEENTQPDDLGSSGDTGSTHRTFSHNPPQTPEEAGSPEEEARAAALSIEVRAIDGSDYEAAPEGSDAPPSVEASDAPIAAAQNLGRTDAVVPESRRFRRGEWQHEFSGPRIGIELARIEAACRSILDERDPKRKRKFTGTRRWHELEEDIIGLKFTGRIPEDQLRELSRLIARRHFLFAQLRFVASTRATWNT